MGAVLAEGTRVAGWDADHAYTQLIREQRAGLVRLAVLIGASRQDAEDAVQNAVIAVGARWSTLRPETALPYLRTAVVHAVRDLHRRQRSTGELPADAPVDDVGLLRFEQDRSFLELVRTLPERQRIVVVLRYAVGLPTGEIATMLGISAITVRSQSSRAIAALRRALEAGR